MLNANLVRLIRGVKTTRYRENSILAYWPYWVAAIIGVVGGLLANLVVSGIYSSAKQFPGSTFVSDAVNQFFCYIADTYFSLQLCIHDASANPARRY